MASHLEIRAAYRAWCADNPSLRINQYPHLAKMIEMAEVEPVDRAFKMDMEYSAASAHIAARLRNLEPNDNFWIENIQTSCLNIIEELQQTPDDTDSLKWLIPFSLFAANTYQLQFIYGGMYKYATVARAAIVKLSAKGYNLGPGSGYNEWRRCTMQYCVRASNKMLEVGRFEQWVAEMEGEDELETCSEDEEGDEGWETETDVGEQDDRPPGLTYSTSTIATSQMPTTPPSKKARGTLRRMGEEDEDDGEKV